MKGWYQNNPRVSEINVYDEANNRRRTTISYHTSTVCRSRCASGGARTATLLRTTNTQYKLDAEYLNRCLIGLVDNVHVYDGPTGALVSKVAYNTISATSFASFRARPSSTTRPTT